MFLLLNDVWLRLPSLMHPEPLIRVFSNHILDDPGKILSIDQDILFPLTRVDQLDRLSDDQPVLSVFLPDHKDRDDRRPCMKCQTG